MTAWHQGTLTQLGRDGAGLLLDNASGQVYGFSLALMTAPPSEKLTDGTPVHFLLNAEGEVAIVETRESLLRLAANLAS